MTDERRPDPFHPTERFSDRVADYVRYRPTYPPELLECLRRYCGLTPRWVVADIGSGTGLLTRIFLENGNRVFALEPNAAMRAAGEEYLDRKSTRLNSSHVEISYAVFCLKKKNKSCFNYEFYNIRLNS